MQTQSIRERRRRKKQLLGTLFLLLGICGILSLLGAYLWVRAHQTQLDKSTLCPADGPRGLTVILFDMTDALNPVQQEALRQELKRIKEEIPIATAIEMYSVRSTQGELLSPEGPALCNPGNSKGISKLMGNPRLAEKKWLEGFEKPINAIVDKMLTLETAPISPILESIQSVAVTAFGKIPNDVNYRRLIIVSDMLQNTEELSQYHQLVPFSQLRNTAYYRKVRADLSHVEVEIIYLRRDTGHQGKDHIEFWQEYFVDCGARLSHIKALQG